MLIGHRSIHDYPDKVMEIILHRQHVTVENKTKANL